jgi:hypothetical protein
VVCSARSTLRSQRLHKTITPIGTIVERGLLSMRRALSRGIYSQIQFPEHGIWSKAGFFLLALRYIKYCMARRNRRMKLYRGSQRWGERERDCHPAQSDTKSRDRGVSNQRQVPQMSGCILRSASLHSSFASSSRSGSESNKQGPVEWGEEAMFDSTSKNRSTGPRDYWITRVIRR